MKRHFALALIMAALLVSPGFAITFSTDLQGPSSIPAAGPFSGADILIPTPPAPGPGPVPIPTIKTPQAMLGIFPGIQNAAEVDAISYGRDNFEFPLLFSVDEFATGLTFPPLPPNVATEGSLGTMEASADIFRYLGFTAPTPIGPIFGNTAVYDGNGLAPTGLPGIGLVEPNPPTPGVTPDPGDNLDALDSLTTPQFPIYFSMDSAFADPLEGAGYNTGTAVANGFVGGDIVVTKVPGGPPVLFASAASLGLDAVAPDTDDLDALILREDGDGEYSLFDFVLFSVRRGSAIIGTPDSILGAPIEEGDILTPPVVPGSAPGIFIPAEALGLRTVRSYGLGLGQFGDDLDALTIIPEPLSLSLLLLAPAHIARRRNSI